MVSDLIRDELPWVLVIVTAAITYIVRYILIKWKARTRSGDLINHVVWICDPHDCKDAVKRYMKCEHIVKHYGVSLESVSVSTNFHGSLPGLCVLAHRSVEKAEKRENATMMQVEAHPDSFPRNPVTITNH